jgi:glutamate/tyrosine decarboxylase-like PLP-dependent enzyme
MNYQEQLRQRCAWPLPHPDLPALREFGEQTLDQVLAHHASLPQQEIGRPASRQEMADLLMEPPPEHPSDFAAVLERFWQAVAPYACRINHPRFLAFIPSAPTWFSVLGHLLCAGTNFFAGVWVEAAGPAQVELVVLDWVRRFLGMPARTEGILTSGGSEANLTALAVARDGLAFSDRSRAVLYVSDQRHWSIDRAARLLGFHPEQIHVIPTGDDLCLRPAPLLSRIRQDRQAGRLPWVVVANAGATNSGVIDPLDALADLCREERLWFHVDAAYGWAGVLGSQVPNELRGIARADSVTFDPHKWLAQAFDVGGVLVREGERLRHTFCLRPEYMQDVEPGEDEVNFADRGLALTRRFRALEVWLSLQVLGVGWYRRLIDHGQALACYAELCLRQAGFEIVVGPRLSIVCFRLHPPGWSEERLDGLALALVEAVRRTGRAFLSSTRLRGRVAIRFCFINWRTCAEDVDQVVGLLSDLGKELVAAESSRDRPNQEVTRSR